MPALNQDRAHRRAPLHDIDHFLKTRYNPAYTPGPARPFPHLTKRPAPLVKHTGFRKCTLTLILFIVARINPIRFRPKEAEPLSFDETMDRLMKAAAQFDPHKIQMADLARTGGAPDETE